MDRPEATARHRPRPSHPSYPANELDPVTNLPVPFTVGPDNVALPGPNIMPRPKGSTGAEEKVKRGD